MTKQEEEIWERVQELRKLYGISETAFAEKIGISQALMSYGNKAMSLSPKVILGIASELPEVSLEWLLRGKGKMMYETSADLQHEVDRLNQIVKVLSESIVSLNKAKIFTKSLQENMDESVKD